MQINITARHIDVTPAIEEYIRRKAERLPRYFDRVQQIDVVLERMPNEYKVEILTDVEKHRDFVATGSHEDLYACVDVVCDRAVRQLTDWKQRIKQHKA